MTAPTETPRPPKQEQLEASEEILEVAPHILRLQLPIDFTGLGHVNTYALEDDRGFALVDPGLPGEKSYKILRARMDAAGIPLARVHTVVVTHSHPDHFGGAGLLAEESGADVVASEFFRTWWDPDDLDDRELDAAPADPDGSLADAAAERAAAGRTSLPGGTTTAASMAAAMAESIMRDPDEPVDPDGPPLPPSPFGRPTPWGGRTEELPPERRAELAANIHEAMRWFRVPRPSIRVADGHHLMLAGREWVGLFTPGHTNDHLCLFDAEEGVLLAGDHVLPTITPHISGMIEGDPLARYVESLDRIASFTGVRTVLPAHGNPFFDLAGRVAEIKEHHEGRLERLTEICDAAGWATVQDLSHQLFSPKAWGSMAESETYAHLEHLRLRGQAERREEGGLLQFRV
jgi:glyoxylase-like metal-dependent hydrolase (beta-lactamase superfamily II)